MADTALAATPRPPAPSCSGSRRAPRCQQPPHPSLRFSPPRAPPCISARRGIRADPVKGEIAVAYVVRAPGVDLDVSDVLNYCGDRLAAYKGPRDVVLVDSLPTTSSGELMCQKLADIDVALADPAATVDSRQSVGGVSEACPISQE
ncbi:MAG: hypothetical protein EOO27_23710 [Comamonadaceae bacterium]|nr:MAG: hypothetical protein EOO27_23710 [Comamonadaceae bacterium]